MKIYQQEQADKIDFKLINEKSCANLMAKIKTRKNFNTISKEDLVKLIEKLSSHGKIESLNDLIGSDQPDLAFIVAILVSTGWNLNDDIFLPDEVWKAKDTIVHKPMNDNHDPTKILGHIVMSRAIDKNENDLSEPVDEFDIEVGGVLYRMLLPDRVDDILKKAESGDIFVSMEAWFPDFSYGIIDSNTNITKVVPRNDQTAFLTKHLRIYGGDGKYQGYRVGRVLHDIVFGAQGFVDTPANPESIIKVAASKFEKMELNEIILEGGVNVDIAEIQKELDDTRAQLKEKDERIIALQAKIDDFVAMDFDKQIAGLTSQIKSLENIKVDLEKKLTEAISRAEKAENDLNEIHKTELARNRLVRLSEVKEIVDEDITLSELRNMSEDVFNVVLKYAGDKKTDTKSDAVADNATAALETVECDNDDPNFEVTVSDEKDESKQWLSMATALLNDEEEEKEGVN